MTALTANALTTHLPDQQLREYPVGAAVHIYRGALVGVDPAGYLKAFEVGDEFVGIAYEESDNTATAASAGDTVCQVYVGGDFEFTLSSAALTDRGKALYATDDATLALVGHPDAFVGRVLHYEDTNLVIFRMKDPFAKPLASDSGSIEYVLNGGHLIDPTGTTTATKYDKGWRVESLDGGGVTNVAGNDGGVIASFDAVSEVATASLETNGVFKVAGGITFEGKLHMSDNGAAAVDFDFGLGTQLTANSRADIDHADMAQLACFHMDANVNNILAQSDDATTDVAATDTTIDNVEAADSFKEFKVICRPDGTCEFWIDKARVLPSTSFGMLSTAGTICGFVNVEKTADASTVQVDIENLRVAGAHT